MEIPTRDIPTISFEVPKSRLSAIFSKKKTRTFYLTAPDPLADGMICSSPATARIAKGEEVSKPELARILAISITNQKLLFVPSFLWAFAKYLETKLDFETLDSLAKIAVLFSSYPDTLRPLLTEQELFIMTRSIYTR